MMSGACVGEDINEDATDAASSAALDTRDDTEERRSVGAGTFGVPLLSSMTRSQILRTCGSTNCLL